MDIHKNVPGILATDALHESTVFLSLSLFLISLLTDVDITHFLTLSFVLSSLS